MHAGVTTFRVRPGKMEEAVRIYLGSMVPVLREQPGFQSIMVLTDPEKDEGYTIGLWETENDAVAFESSGRYREEISKLGGLLEGIPERKVYEVSIQM